MKTYLVPLFALFFFSGLQIFAQKDQDFSNRPAKNNQGTFENEVYGGYGAGSIYYFINRLSHSSGYPTEMSSYDNGYLNNQQFSNPTSPGNFFIGYGRSLNHVISMGFMFSYQQFNYKGTAQHYIYDYSGTFVDTTYNITSDDRLLTGVARVQFTYVNKPFIRMYSGIGIGITVDFAKGSIGNNKVSEQKLMPAGQLTLMGLRFGRAFGGFFEFGFGSYGIINAGISYKFKD
jgi:hypothetical protein